MERRRVSSLKHKKGREVDIIITRVKTEDVKIVEPITTFSRDKRG